MERFVIKLNVNLSKAGIDLEQTFSEMLKDLLESNGYAREILNDNVALTEAEATELLIQRAFYYRNQATKFQFEITPTRICLETSLNKTGWCIDNGSYQMINPF